jgi:hypothetical protein
MRPDKSQIRGTGASRLGVSMVAAQFAAVEGDRLSVGRASRLGGALARLAQELAAARREIAVLKRENMALRSRLDGGVRHG